MFTYAVVSLIALFYMVFRRQPQLEAHLNNPMFFTDGTHVTQDPRQDSLRPDIGSDPHTTGRPTGPASASTVAGEASTVGTTPTGLAVSAKNNVDDEEWDCDMLEHAQKTGDTSEAFLHAVRHARETRQFCPNVS